MKHKEYLEWLKENDPMLYSEITSDPCGTSSDDDSGIIILCIFILLIGGIIMTLIK